MNLTQFKQIEINESGSLRLTVLLIQTGPQGAEVSRAPHQVVVDPLEDFDERVAVCNASLERDLGFPVIPDVAVSYARASRAFAHEQPMIAERIAALREERAAAEAEHAAEVERMKAAEAAAATADAERIAAAARQMLIDAGVIKDDTSAAETRSPPSTT